VKVELWDGVLVTRVQSRPPIMGRGKCLSCAVSLLYVDITGTGLTISTLPPAWSWWLVLCEPCFTQVCTSAYW
jgi:hypothetical protein